MKEEGGTKSVQSRFTAASSTYDDHAWVQSTAAKQLLPLLDSLGTPDVLLEVGCGTGQLTGLLLERFPQALLHAVDLAPGMVRAAQRVLGASGRVEWFAEDARTFSQDRKYPGIVANCSLHWLEPLPETLRHLAGLLAEGGTLAAAVMTDGTLRELHAARRKVAPGKIPPGRLPTAAFLRKGLVDAGLEIQVFHEMETVVVCSSPDKLLEQLRRQGLTGGDVSRAQLPLNRTELQHLRKEYQLAYQVEGGVSASYRVAFFRAVRVGLKAGLDHGGRCGSRQELDGKGRE